MTAPLRIALIAHPRHPIRPPFRGGLEAHTWHLARELDARGHEVVLFASGDSEAGVPLRPLLEEHYDRRYPWADYHGSKVLTDLLDGALRGALDEIARGGFDVVHNNGLHRFPPRLARAVGLPMVTALHVPPFDALHRAIHESAAPWSRVTVTSRRQLQAWWPKGAPKTAHVVPNGIDLDLWPYRDQGDGSAVWTGRIAPNKGPHLALDAARIAGTPLTLFGTIEDQAYFDAEIAPRLGGTMRYGGHLPGPELAQEMGRASAALFTPLWDEPFGLAAIEAMACGLPVAATDMGAVREVIGPAGVFAPPHDAEALAAALMQAQQIPRIAARARVEAAFTLERMVENYEDLYHRAIAAAPRREAGLQTRFPPWELPAVAGHAPAPASRPN